MFSRHPFDRCDSAPQERALLERDRAVWLEHLWSCRACREESRASEALASALETTAVPRLSAHFDARLRTRLRREDAPRRLPSGVRRWMAAYWIATGALSAFIALRTGPLTLERCLDAFVTLALVWGIVEIVPPRAIRRAVALLG